MLFKQILLLSFRLFHVPIYRELLLMCSSSVQGFPTQSSEEPDNILSMCVSFLNGSVLKKNVHAH